MEKKRKIDIGSLEYIPIDRFEFKPFYKYVFSIDDPLEGDTFVEFFENVDQLFSKFDEDRIVVVFVADDYIDIMTIDYIHGLGHQVHFWRANIL